jgi:carbon storage regulator CsrA
VLVVRRRAGELIRIGGDVELRLLSIGKTSVRLGIEAPRSIIISIRESEAGTGEKNCGDGRSVEMSGEV